MYSIGDDFYTPVMHQDLMSGPMTNPMMNPMTGMGMMGGMYPSYLGGTQMAPQPFADNFLATKAQKVNEDKKNAKGALALIAGGIALACVPIFRKQLVKAGGFKNLLANIKTNWAAKINKFKTKSPATTKDVFNNIGASIKDSGQKAGKFLKDNFNKIFKKAL